MSNETLKGARHVQEEHLNTRSCGIPSVETQRRGIRRANEERVATNSLFFLPSSLSLSLALFLPVSYIEIS